MIVVLAVEDHESLNLTIKRVPGLVRPRFGPTPSIGTDGQSSVVLLESLLELRIPLAHLAVDIDPEAVITKRQSQVIRFTGLNGAFARLQPDVSVCTLETHLKSAVTNRSGDVATFAVARVVFREERVTPDYIVRGETQCNRSLTQL